MIDDDGLLIILGQNIYYAGYFVVVAGARGDFAVDTSSNTNIGCDTRSALCVDGSVTVVDGFGDLRPRAL